MRKPIIVAVSLLFVVTAAFAQQPSHSNTISVFVSDLGFGYSSSTGTDVTASYGMAFDHRFNEHLSGEVSVTSERVHRSFVTVNPTGAPSFFTLSDTLYPVDANISYHFLTHSRWKPYLGAGMRYMSSSFYGQGTSGPLVRERNVDPEVSGGVIFQFRPNLGLRFDAKQTLGSIGSRSSTGDPALRASVGVSFRF